MLYFDKTGINSRKYNSVGVSVRRKNINASDKVSFQGQLEEGFFSAMKTGDDFSAKRKLEKINFDITEQDKENGNNVFHYILQDNSFELWDKLNNLLKNIVSRIAPEKITIALSAKNNQNKTPFECAVDSSFLEYVKSSMPNTSNPFNQAVSVPEPNKDSEVINSSLSKEQKNTNDNSVSEKTVVSKEQNELVGNELKSWQEIDGNLGFDEFINVFEDDIVNDGVLSDVIGLSSVKEILEDYIISPIKEKRPILVNGFLIYGTGNNGKTYIVENLCKELDREIINTKKMIGILEKSDLSFEAKEKIFDKYVISISIDDYRNIDDLLEYIEENYKKTGKQTLIYIDELAKLFQSGANTDGRYSTRDIPEFIRKFDNISQKGGVLIGTTNNIDLIESDILRSNRFQKKIEVKYPTQEERNLVFEKFMKNKLDMSESDYIKILKKTAGFSYGDLTVICKLLNANSEKIGFAELSDKLEAYAKENSMGQLSDEGTTSNYDSFLKRSEARINFSDVAGMDDVKEIFTKTIIERLKPEIIQRFKDNKRPVISTNFLLYGPPGTGKTFIVEALSGESKIPLYKVDAATFKDKYWGESEKNLKKIFNQLETKFKETGEYSILFIDEANKILGNRNDSGSQDSEYVEQLLQYIDNSFERGIITITATNYKERVDEAVLSRLGQQIMIGYPDMETIKFLIKIILKDIKSAKNITDEDISGIAKCLRGFGSREIKQMITSIVDDNLQGQNKELTLDDFKEGISKYAQSHELPAINDRNRTSAYDKYIKRLEISPDDPQSLDDIGGMHEVKEKLLNAIVSSSMNPKTRKRYEANKVKSQNGILLYGLPGCGKTYIMKALAAHLDLPIYEFKLSTQGSKWAHETTENIGKVFAQLAEKYKRTGERSILMLDEFEDIASNREGQQSYRVEETNTLLKEISNAERNGIIVVAATNHYDQIDDAIKRPGRFVSIEVTPPDYEARKDIIKKSLYGREIAERIFDNEENFTILANETDGFAIVDITETINRLVKTAIDNDIDKLSVDDVKKALIERRSEKVKEQEINKKGYNL